MYERGELEHELFSKLFFYMPATVDRCEMLTGTRLLIGLSLKFWIYKSLVRVFLRLLVRKAEIAYFLL